MSQWIQWIRDFVKRWFINLVDGLDTLDLSNRKIIMEKVSKIPTSTKELELFKDVWNDLSNSAEVKKKVNDVLDKIEDCDESTQIYFNQWFKEFMLSISHLDDKTREEILKPCGIGCAKALMLNKFKEVKNKSKNLESFIKNINEVMGEGELFTYVNENLIRVVYPKCFCPLVDNNFVSSSNLCNCSKEWLHTNFSAALEKAVEIEQVVTVLSGGKECRFNINITQ